jgi:predicted RNase H-like HicB family nuclease
MLGFILQPNLQFFVIFQAAEYMNIKAIVHPAEEGGYWAEVSALPGCITEGDSMEEVMANLKDAIEGWLEVANS